MTIYKRNKNLPKNFVQPIQKAHDIKMEKEYDSTAQYYRQVPVTRTFTYIHISTRDSSICIK